MLILETPRSGSVAGVTASRNRFGQYYRTRAIPVQPRTPKQTINRAFLTVGSSAWRSLGDTDRTAWNDYAQQIVRSGRLGSSYSPTGAALFSGAFVLAPAGIITVPPTTLPNYVLSIGGMTYVDPTPGPEALNVFINTTSADNKMLLETSGPVSPGITSAAAVRRWRTLPDSADNLQPVRFDMSASPADIITNYKFLFPSPVTGQAIWFRFREVFFDGTTDAGITNTLFQTFRLVIA